MLGELEYLLISAAARLGDNAYGASIQRELHESAGRACSTGALYTTLDRLEKKGLLETWMGDPTPERGGRRKRLVRLTAEGEREAAAFYNAVVRASRGVAWESSRWQRFGDASPRCFRALWRRMSETPSWGI